MIFDPDRPYLSNPNVPEWVKHLALRQERETLPDDYDSLKKSWSIQYGLPWPYDTGTPAEHHAKANPKRGYTLDQWELARFPSAVVRDCLIDISARAEFHPGSK